VFDRSRLSHWRWGKGKGRPRTSHEGPEEEKRYSSTLSLTWTLARRGGWWTPRPGRFTPRKETRYPVYRRLSGPQGRCGRVRKISPPPGFDTRTVQPVASRYTDWAIAAHNLLNTAWYFTQVRVRYQLTVDMCTVTFETPWAAVFHVTSRRPVLRIATSDDRTALSNKLKETITSNIPERSIRLPCLVTIRVNHWTPSCYVIRNPQPAGRIRGREKRIFSDPPAQQAGLTVSYLTAKFRICQRVARNLITSLSYCFCACRHFTSASPCTHVIVMTSSPWRHAGEDLVTMREVSHQTAK
jgi:hypothetical protein